MTDAELYAAIQADPQAQALARAGDDAGCAARLAAVLPPAIGDAYLTDRTIVGVFADPAAGYGVVAKFRAVAAQSQQSNPLLVEVVGWLKPSEGGINFGLPAVRAMLDQLQAAGVFTAAEVATLKAQAERPVAVAAEAVSRAMLRDRPNGKVS